MINKRIGKLLDIHLSSGYFWMRIPSGGWGFYVKNLNQHPLLFSERNGYVRHMKLGRWWAGYMPPIHPGNAYYNENL